MEPIENQYFNWLCAKVLEWNNQNYHALLKLLHRTEYSWTVTGDRNRAGDGIELRLYFCRETGVETDSLWDSQPCSLLEFFIAFADRAAFQTEISLKDWFWIFMTNLRLEDYSRVSKSDRRRIEDILYVFLWRQYDDHGNGGLFPLNNPKKDQRTTEIWYQFFEYIDEKQIM